MLSTPTPAPYTKGAPGRASWCTTSPATTSALPTVTTAGTEAGAVGFGVASELTKALNGTNSPWTYKIRPAMVKMWPAEVLMDMFGTSGMTAYFGMRECGPLMPRDRVAVAAATGSVGPYFSHTARKRNAMPTSTSQ